MVDSLGILYVCGELTGGTITIAESLVGRKVRRVSGAYDRILAVVDAWELEWLLCPENDKEAAVDMETELVTKKLQNIKIQQIAAGKDHNVALSLDGQLYSWGQCGTTLQWNELGSQHGHVKTTATSATIPHRITTAPHLVFTHVSCGRNHSAAVTDTGDLYTWGRNIEGQLGHVLKTLSKEMNARINAIGAWPKYVGFFIAKPRIVSACCGNTFTAVLLTDGSIYLLGGSSLQPGLIDTCQRTNTHKLILEERSIKEHFVDLASGSEHIVAVTNAGEMFSWGLNTFGQLGQDGMSDKRTTQAQVGKAVFNIVASNQSIKWARVFAGGSYSAALTTNNQLYTWGNGRYGKLGHGSHCNDPRKYDCEFVPRCVENLQHTEVSSVICGDRNLFVFASTSISGMSPLCGDYTGGYELRIRGSGFWASENVTVRFVPLLDNRLLRGTLGEFCEATGEIVCHVPKFRLTGEYVVDVAMDGKNFTSNGRVLTVFERPQVAAVSAYDTQCRDREELTLSLCGHLPLMCQHPIVRFVRCCVSRDSGQIVALNNTESAALVVGKFDQCSDSGKGESVRDLSDVTGRLLRLTLPAFSIISDGIVPYTLEISYDSGILFSPVCVDPTLRLQNREDTDNRKFANPSSQPEPVRLARPHVLWVHEAQLVRVIPNSFLMDDLPHTITLNLSDLLPPEVAQLLVTIEHHLPTKKEENDDADPLPQTFKASATLSIDNVDATFVTCTIPSLTNWHITPPIGAQALQRAANWWKTCTETGFVSQIHVSMNAGRTVLSSQPQLGGKSSFTASQIFGMPAPGRLLSVFPDVGTVRGGTQVSVAGDFLHFDTGDATVKLKWRDHCVVLSAICSQPERFAAANEGTTTTRRVIFQTPSFPLPDDTAAMTEDMIFHTREEVELFVSLDGEHYTDASLTFTYCAVPEICGISPNEAEPGTKMVLTMKNLIATPSACAKLEAVLSKISMVIPVTIDEAANTVEFVLPELPLGREELVHLAISLNGQEFTSVNTNTPDGGDVTFRYKALVT